MRFYFFTVFLFLCLKAWPQQDVLARQYFNEGRFEKAALYYEKLYQNNPRRVDYLEYLVNSYQQLERYADAEKVIVQHLNASYGNPVFYVALGYNHALQNNEERARQYYDKAMDKITGNASYSYAVGNAFRKKSLLEYAVKAFEKGIAMDPEANFNLNYSIASIYGEMGNIEKMYDTYLRLLERKGTIMEIVKRRIGDFITGDPTAENNTLLKKVLLKKSQSAPNLIWNDLLSWLFIQQKQFGNAFVQEKALYKRTGTASLERIMQLGLLALEERDTTTAKAIFEFTLANTLSYDVRLKVHRYLLDIAIAVSLPENYPEIEEKFTALFAEYGYTVATVPLQTAYAQFLVFRKKESKKAIALLKRVLKLPLNPFDEAKVKMVLADVFVYEESFNQALIYYAQIQNLVKNDVLAQMARFKTAQTSFYKGDFKWAETQLKVLKSSTSQLIANDALQLKLLISDNAYEDSTQTALKRYAKADLLAYQNRDDEAVALLDEILTLHKGEAIEDEALLKQGQLLEKKKEFNRARLNYVKITEFYSYGILVDDALFALARLLENHLNEPEKAKAYYEKIILGHQDSIYFVTARKSYRKLRGDAIN